MDEEGDIGLVFSSQETSSSSLASASVPSSSTSNYRVETDSVLMRKLMPSNSPRSPSSPDLILTPTKATRTVSRSRTLPLRMGPTRRASIPTLEGVSLESSKLERLRRWILGLAIVNFDLDLGPVLTCVFPPAHLSPSEVENIAFSAFPDSPQFEEGSQIHSFRIRESSSQEKRGSFSEPRSTSLSDGYIYGYSHFSQRKNLSSKRGYEQRSIVILSHYPYPALFFHVISKLGPLFHTHGDPILEVACHNIANWPSPAPSTTIELGFLGSVFHAELPLSLDEQQLSNTAHLHSQTEQDTHILVSAPPPTPPPLLLFEASFSHLWSIWEVLILSEPLLVYGPSPAMTSQAVWWLRDLFRPIPWPGDFRPYFTIHDKEHNALVNEKRPKAGLLLGVTNPFFERACQHWPHSLSLGKPRPKGAKSMAPIAAGQPPGWKTKTHKRYTLKDRQLLQQMEDAFRSGPQALDTASANMRRHFSSRTAALLVPFNRYLNTLIPSPFEALHSSRSDRTSRLKPFNNVNFLASLKTHGTPLPFRSNSKQREFYERWLRTPAFGLWLARQEEVVERVLRENAERGLGGQS